MKLQLRIAMAAPGLFLALALLSGMAVPAANGQTDASLQKTYRLRIENRQYGRIEVSADGAHYFLVGRVLHPATALASDKVATTPGSVLRSGNAALTFAVAPGKTLKLRPYTSSLPSGAGRKRRHPSVGSRMQEASAIITNLEPGRGLFGELLPPFRCPVRLETGTEALMAFPAAYTPTEDDVFVFLVTLPPAPANEKEAVRQRVERLAQVYAAGAVSRARAENRMVVSGLLTLRAKLPPGEPDPIAAVTYAIDNHVVAAQNTPPFVYTWDTRQVSDGEHVVEIRALNGGGGLLTRARALIVVHNAASEASAPPPM
ncbi:MAG TPA: Ig-like domain-containing protein [Chthonomonadaceae bacterium]|nr:Ig-like domain-containing protein [Chthonomonadaceae bacterium]